jgi:hypothetical protein
MRLPQLKSILVETTLDSTLDFKEISFLLNAFADREDYDIPGIEHLNRDINKLQQYLLSKFGLLDVSDDDDWMNRLRAAKLETHALFPKDRAVIHKYLKSLSKAKGMHPGAKAWKDKKHEDTELIDSILKKLPLPKNIRLPDHLRDDPDDPKTFANKGSSKVPSMQWTDPWAGRVSSSDALAYLEEYEESLKKAGVKISGEPRVLGDDRGAQGTPVDIGGTVLKFTRDRTEANASYRIKGKKLKNVANIYNVYELGDEHVYVIHQELLQPLDMQIKTNWSMFRVPISIYFKTKSKEKALQSGMENIDWNFPGNHSLRDTFISVLHQSLNAAEELMSNKIIAPDRHSDNVMQRDDGTIVLIDLGLSRSPEVSIPSVT